MLPARRLAAAFLLIAAAGSATAAEREPRIEAGMGLAAYTYTDWRGAENRNTTLLPVPYFIYRGERVRLARDGLRVKLLDSDRVTLNLAAAFALAGDAADNPAREGMRELLSTFNAGPVLNISLDAVPDPVIRWDLRLPVFLVAGTNFRRFENAGFTAFPSLRARYETQRNAWNFRVGASAGVELANERNNDYFYQVRASEARPNRQAFDAKAGYGGAVVSSFLAASRGRWGYGVYVRFDALQGATFEDSPLVQRKNFYSAGLGLTYSFYRSRDAGSDDASE